MGDEDENNKKKPSATVANSDETDEEARLRERLKAKQRERRRSNSDDGKDDEKRNGSERHTNKEDTERDQNGEKKSPPDKNHRGFRSRSREIQRRGNSNSRDRRSSSSQRTPHRGPRGRGPPRIGGRGPPPPGWHGPPGGPPYPDPYGRYPPGPAMPYRAGYGPPPPRSGYGGGAPDYGPSPPHAPPHYSRRRPPPSAYESDQYGRAPRRYHRSRSPSYSYRSDNSGYSRSSRSRSASPESDRSKRSLSEEEDRSPGRHRKRHRHGSSSRGRRSRSPSTSGSSVSGSSLSSSSSSSSDESEGGSKKNHDDTFTKDQRTIFVNQLVMRTTAKDIRRYFRRQIGAKVNDVIMLKDRRTGKHKGCAYVEMKSMDDVGKVLNVSGQPPDFQRFPILIKPSEAEKNYQSTASSAAVTVGNASTAAPLIGSDGLPIEAQKVYVGSLDPSISQEHLFKLFNPFGDLTKVSLQMDPASGISKGYAFLSFRDPKDANLAIQTMSNQVLAGRCMKTGWATQAVGSAPGVRVVQTDEFPEDASARAQKAHVVLSQMSIGAGLVSTVASVINPALMAGQPLPAPGAPSKVPTVAEARQSLATAAASGIASAAPSAYDSTSLAAQQAAAALLSSPDAKIIGGSHHPTRHLLVHNMFDKDEETEPGWEEEIKTEFQEECSKFGKIEKVVVMSKEPGGKIYASFDSIEAAKTCASSLAGRWFDKRQLRVEYVPEDAMPN